MHYNHPVNSKSILISLIAFLLLSSFTGKDITINEKTSLTDTLPVRKINNVPPDAIVLNESQKSAPIDKPSESASVLTQPMFPGGKAAWFHYLTTHLSYPEQALERNIEGTVVVEFTLDEKGRPKNVNAVSGPLELRHEAVRVVRASGKWTPAKYNRVPVPTVMKQLIIFHREVPTVTRPDDMFDEIKSPDRSPGNTSSISVSLPKDTSVAMYKVGTESSYPGGAGAWIRFLNKTMRYPKDAARYGIEGTVIAQFIIDTDGSVVNAQILSGPSMGGLREEVLRIIKKSGKWTPAMQDGIPVKSYKKQPFTFRTEVETRYVSDF